MIVSKQTIKSLARRGITIRPTFHDFNEQLQREWEWSYNYCSTDTPENERKAQADAWISNTESRTRHWWSNSTTLYIFDGDAIYEMKNRPKWSETNLDDIEKRIARERKKYNSPYGAFCRKMQRLLRDDQIKQGFCIYPTTYGIGVWVILNWQFNDCVNVVESLMKKHNIEYSNEFSDKAWVYRFKVSKKAENLAKIG